MRVNNCELEGKQFGMLTVISHKDKINRTHRFECMCECGKTTIVRKYHLLSGHTQSCGCASSRATMGHRAKTHGLRNTREFNIWAGMKARCLNKNNPSYKNYGGRGITICNRWLKFENFYDDMGICPEGMSLDRIDNDMGYSKENCRWATRKQQANNSRRIHLITSNGLTMSITEWAKFLGVDRTTLNSRIKAGSWPDGSKRQPKIRRGEDSPHSKLKENQVIQIKIRCANGESNQKIADDFNVSRSSIRLIKNGKNWAHIPSNMKDGFDVPGIRIEQSEKLRIG